MGKWTKRAHIPWGHSFSVQFDDGLKQAVMEALEAAAPITIAMLGGAVQDRLDAIGATDTNIASIKKSWFKTARFDKSTKEWIDLEGPTGSRTAEQWPIKSGESASSFRWFTRLTPPSKFEAVITNDAMRQGGRYAFMLKGKHLPTNQTAMKYLVINPLKKLSKKMADVLADEIAEKF